MVSEEELLPKWVSKWFKMERNLIKFEGHSEAEVRVSFGVGE